jgi:hypothetical protein
MTRHLGTCAQRQAAIAKAESTQAASETLYHLRVQDAYQPEFWLDLEMPGSKSLKALDKYLREIWLECCGHLSEFLGKGSFAREIGMSHKIQDVLAPGITLTHIYDFGTSSETEIKCVETRAGKPMTQHPLVLMARNLSPAYECIECGQPATHLCLECLNEEETWGTLCDQHTATHPHDNYGEPIALVNSPRLGMCGYTGPADPPY